MQELNTENYKTFLRKIIEDLNKWRDIDMFMYQNTQYCYNVNSPPNHLWT